MFDGCDMIANLNCLPDMPALGSIKIKRAFVADKEIILRFVEEHFQKNWVYECEKALLSSDVSKCFIATEYGKVLGFACYDSTAKGFFGPIGVDETRRGEKIGQALLIRTLAAMHEYGYAYGIIGWVGDAEVFYRKTVGAEFIKGGEPEKSEYKNMVMM